MWMWQRFDKFFFVSHGNLLAGVENSNTPCHQYLTNYPVDDALVVVSKGEYPQKEEIVNYPICGSAATISPPLRRSASTYSIVATYASVERLSSIVPSRQCRPNKPPTTVFHVRATRSRCFSSQRRLQEQLGQLFYSFSMSLSTPGNNATRREFKTARTSINS